LCRNGLEEDRERRQRRGNQQQTRKPGAVHELPGQAASGLSCQGHGHSTP
jgi:hypothetical protein